MDVFVNMSGYTCRSFRISASGDKTVSGTVLLVPVVPLFLKHPQPCVRTIEHVVNQAAIVCSFRSSRPHKLPKPRHFINKQFLTPFPRDDKYKK